MSRFISLKQLPLLGAIVLIIALPIVLFALSRPQDVRQRASAPIEYQIGVSPSSGTYVVGQTFSVDMVIDTKNTTFNAASATVIVSSNLAVQALTILPPATGCNFTFINGTSTPTTYNPSFAGAILNGSTKNCTLYTMTLRVVSPGTGNITIPVGSVKAYSDSSELEQNMQSGSYTLSAVPTPTPSPTPTPWPTATPTPMPTPTPVVIAPPTIDTQKTPTYTASVTLTGTKLSSVPLVYVNSSSNGVTYPPGGITWTLPTTLVVGTNTFDVYGQDLLGNKSTHVSKSISLHRLGDINGDGFIDLIDLSLFANDWGYCSPNLLNSLSDMSGGGCADLTSFSIFARVYGN